MKLALGTVQFGMRYGAFNHNGQINGPDRYNILQFAHRSGINVLDTAHAYGDSERMLGEFHAAQKFRIVSKCPPLVGLKAPGQQLVRYFENTLLDLKTEHVYGYLLHRADDLIGENATEIWQALCNLREQGKVSLIGVSAYTPNDILQLLDRFPLTLIQLPANILTEWLYEGDFLHLCQTAAIEIHVRSAFLQGFLLADPTHLAGHLAQWGPTLVRFRKLATSLGLTQMQASLSSLLSQPDISNVVVGVDSKRQLEEIVEAVDTVAIDPKVFQGLATKDIGLMDPRTWPN